MAVMLWLRDIMVVVWHSGGCGSCVVVVAVVTSQLCDVVVVVWHGGSCIIVMSHCGGCMAWQ